jgi:hypothetical protein
MRRLDIVAVGLALVVGVFTMVLTGCASGKVVEKTVVATPTVAPASTPEPKPAITLDDAPAYLDVSAALPGFRRLDARAEGMTKEALLGSVLGKGIEKFSEVELYLSEEPLQYVFTTMGVFSSEMELAAWKAEVRAEKTVPEQVVEDFAKGFAARTGLSGTPQYSVDLREMAVGDYAKLFEISLLYEGEQSHLETVYMFQENALVLIYDLWYSTQPPAVDILTVARAVSARIANR